jgi:thiosulfate reductase cytochrome b subunit
MRIGDIATGRAGDKGDVLDLTLVAYTASDYAALERLVTAAEAARVLHRVVPGDVIRYELPNLRALKFVAPSALTGGVHASLRAGLHWQKAAIWLLLDHDVEDKQR